MFCFRQGKPLIYMQPNNVIDRKLPTYCHTHHCRETINANSTFEKEFTMTPLLANNSEKRGIAVDGRLKDGDTNLASTTL